MGENNSTCKRVTPVFRELKKLPSSSWLERLLQLLQFGSPKHLSGLDFCPIELVFEDQENSVKEKSLAPPVALLFWLICNPEILCASKGGKKILKSADHSDKRYKLLTGNNEILREALERLRMKNESHGNASHGWYIFEGETCPDVYIETSNLIVVIEGKFTEPEPTRDVEWMPGRHQMLRHLDCAWEIRGSKRVVGLFIVEGQGGNGDVPADWQEYTQNTISPGAIASSLPHRGPDEQKQIAECFIGVTTWQHILREFNLSINLAKAVSA